MSTSLLRALEPEIALVQEAKDIPEWLVKDYAVFQAANTATWVKLTWGSMVLVRRTLTAERLPWEEKDGWLRHMDPYVVVAEVTLPGDHKTVVASVHAPPDHVQPRHGLPGTAEELDAARLQPIGEWKKTPKVWYSDIAFMALKRNLRRGQRFVIGGDWNTGRLYDNSSQFDPPIGTAHFVRARRAGWMDCNAWLGQQEVQSYFREGASQYQTDHVFCDRKTVRALNACRVEDSLVVREISDHTPVIAQFGSFG